MCGFCIEVLICSYPLLLTPFSLILSIGSKLPLLCRLSILKKKIKIASIHFLRMSRFYLYFNRESIDVVHCITRIKKSRSVFLRLNNATFNFIIDVSKDIVKIFCKKIRNFVIKNLNQFFLHRNCFIFFFRELINV